MRHVSHSPTSDEAAIVDGFAVLGPAWVRTQLKRRQCDAWFTERISEEVLKRGTTINGPLAVAFAEELRRYYPFVPLLPAMPKRDLVFDGAQVKAGDRVVIDIYGTNRDERHWDSPETFDPERFLDTGEVFADYFVPQGGGQVETGHRCPGEAITVGLLALTAGELSHLDAEVARDGLESSMRRLPTGPKNGVLLSQVRRRG